MVSLPAIHFLEEQNWKIIAFMIDIILNFG